MSQSTKVLSETLNRPKPTNELREFILDPKSSVKKFVETSISPSHPSQQQQQQSNSGTWSNFSNGNPQDHHAGPQLPQRRPHIRGRLSSYSDYTAEAVAQVQDGNHDLPAQMSSHAKPSSAMEYASFVSSRPNSIPQEHAAAYSGAPSGAKEHRPVGPAPPPAETPSVTTLPAPRLYHRMITEYETIKAVFYTALVRKSSNLHIPHSLLVSFPLTFPPSFLEPIHNDLSPLAAKLKSLCRDIWSIRYLNAGEFPYNEATTEERITEWKTQFEYWRDVLEDLLDARYVQRAALEARESDWPGVAGLASVAAAAAAAAAAVRHPTKGTATAKAAVTPADEDDDDEDEPPAPPVKKKAAKGGTATDGDAAAGKKKKTAKKAAAE